MLKKFLPVLCLFLIFPVDYSNGSDDKSDYYRYKTETIEKTEKIKHIVISPDNNVYLLGEINNYQFPGVEAKKKFKNMLDILQINGFNSKNFYAIQKSIEIDKYGEARFCVSMYFRLSADRSNKKEMEEQERFINEFNKRLEEKNIKFSVENGGERHQKSKYKSWFFVLGDGDIFIEGKPVDLASRDEILNNPENRVEDIAFEIRLEKEVKVRLSESEEKMIRDNESFSNQIGKGAAGLLIPLFRFFKE